MKKPVEQIHYNMQQIHNKDSEIELRLRKALWHKGYRYRKNVKNIFGHPDIVFMNKRIAIFCDSEFWHGYDWENKKSEFKVRREFWIPKIERNIKRDEEVTNRLTAEGWTVLRFWGKEIKNDLEGCLTRIEKVYNGK